MSKVYIHPTTHYLHHLHIRPSCQIQLTTLPTTSSYESPSTTSRQRRQPWNCSLAFSPSLPTSDTTHHSIPVSRDQGSLQKEVQSLLMTTMKMISSQSLPLPTKPVFRGMGRRPVVSVSSQNSAGVMNSGRVTAASRTLFQFLTTSPAS